MVHRRFCSLVIWIASLALLCSLKVQAAEIDSSLSYMDTFDYLVDPPGGDYDYEPILSVPETNKPSVTKPTDTPSQDPVNNPPSEPEPEPEPEPSPEAPSPAISIDMGIVSVPGLENITNGIISNLPNNTAPMAPQPEISVDVATAPAPVMPLPQASPSPPSPSSSSRMVSVVLAGIVCIILL